MMKNRFPSDEPQSMPLCPGCREPAVSLVDTILTSDLSRLYRSRGIDVESYFQGTPLISRLQCEICDLVFFSPPCAGDDSFYEQLQKFSWYYQDSKPEYEYARQYVQENQSVLEVGCGKGAFRSFLPELTRYVGLEFNDVAVRKANDAGLNVRKQSIEQHAASHAQNYDVICSFQVLEHVPSPNTFVHACVKALAPNGILIIAVPAEDSFLSLAANAPLNLPPHHVLRWTDRALRHLAERENLSVTELWHEPIASYHRDWQLQTLAQHYFVMRGITCTRLIDKSLRYRVIARLLRNAQLRNFLAQRVIEDRPLLLRGHTVVLVAKQALLV
jgi:SAM-dependent methyltransferase